MCGSSFRLLSGLTMGDDMILSVLPSIQVYLGIRDVADGGSFLARPLRVDSCEPGTIGGIGGAIETVLFATSEKVPVSRY